MFLCIDGESGCGLDHRARIPYVPLQYVEHALLCDLLGVVELLQGLLDLVLAHLALALLLVVEVQATALQLLKMVLQEGDGGEERRGRPEDAGDHSLVV